MSTYRKEWDCCGDVSETQGWEPESCPFCRASPAAAVPEGAMPPKMAWIDAPDVISDAQAEAWAIGWNACRAAVEADRAQRPDLREQFDTAFLSLNGFHTRAELNAEWAAGSLSGEMFRAGAASRAERAQQGESEKECRRPGCECSNCKTFETIKAMDAEITKLRAALADRAQQGEPVAGAVELMVGDTVKVRAGGGLTCDEDFSGRIGVIESLEVPDFPELDCAEVRFPDGSGLVPLRKDLIFVSRAATKAAAGAAALKDHEIREAVNQLRDVALQFHGAGSLRARIHNIVLPLVKRAAPAPDTGIPTAGEDDLRALGTKMAAWLYGLSKSSLPYESWATRCKEYSDAWDKLSARAPVSSTPTSGEVEKAGWKWVPVEPTDEMREACRVLNYCDDIDAEWARMLAAAPSHPSEAKAGDDA